MDLARYRTMAFSQREKDAEKALRRLTPVFDKMLSPDVRVDLYGRDMLTWHENERILGGLIAASL